MKLGSVRDLEGNRPVLKDPDASGPDPVYWVFPEISDPSATPQDDKAWANMTVIVPGRYGNEYPKTFGHYHGTNVNETYHLVEGEGVLVMQKRILKDDNIVEDQVEEVYLIKAKPGDEILITPEWGHSWSNVGKLPLISFDDWRSGHKPSDYEIIKNMQGMAYYLVDENGEVKAVANPKYENLPEAKWITAEEFKKL
ncbi:hypothetical protein HY025_00415 [Candidatus Daviesbacteria bacterium]|nr:hypothetical protein [Candidatus Daviesbacteria bacterium]